MSTGGVRPAGPASRAPRAGRPPGAATSVEAWFARRTRDGREYDVPALTALRQAHGTTVSCILPARNEAGTVGPVVEAVAALRPQLVDEVVVVDARSTDATAALAREAGARVVIDAALPPGPPCLGKGDALWRALGATSGDLVVFMDTDIRNPSPSFVSGLLGPLLTDPDVAFVKGFYDRPLEVDGVLAPTGGGRVTELTARPLLNLHWPHLAGLAQPLAGEYAGRRDALESVPFFTGYGVEFGLLIDLARTVGRDAIAQVDLGRRVHRNQDLPALARMAHAIHLVARRRLQEDGRSSADEARPVFRQVERGPDGRPVLTASVPDLAERPPRRAATGAAAGLSPGKVG